MGASTDAVDGAAASFDPNEIVAEIVELLLDTSLASFADGDNTDDCGDADGDPQDRENAAHFISEQCDESGSKESRVVHRCSADAGDACVCELAQVMKARLGTNPTGRNFDWGEMNPG